MTLLKIESEYLSNYLYWKAVKLRYGISDMCHMIILSDDDPEMDYYALKHLPEYFRRFFLERVVLVSEKYEDIPLWEELSDLRIKIVRVNGRQMKKLKKISRMYAGMIKTISLDYPQEKMLKNLPGVRGITKEDILCLTEYQLFKYERVVPYECE